MGEGMSDSTVSQRLLQQVRVGDARAFEQLFSLHRSLLVRAVAKRLDPRLRARVDPSDIVQDAQLDAFRRLGDYLKRRPMPLRLWLWKTAHQHLVKAQRRHLEAARRAVGKELPRTGRSSLAMAGRVPASCPSPSQQVASSDRARQVRRGLGQLSASDREIVQLRTFDEFSFDEIAGLLDIDSAAARKRYGRALLRLRRILKETGLPESAL